MSVFRGCSRCSHKFREPIVMSLAISSELSMRPLMERVLSRREILGA